MDVDEDFDTDFDEFPALPAFGDEIESGVQEESAKSDGSVGAVERFRKFFADMTTEQKIIIATTIPSIIVVVMLCVLVLAYAFACKRPDNTSDEEDLEVILISNKVFL